MPARTVALATLSTLVVLTFTTTASIAGDVFRARPGPNAGVRPRVLTPQTLERRLHSHRMTPPTSGGSDTSAEAMAVGPAHIVRLTRSDLTIFEKATGSQLFRVPLETWCDLPAAARVAPACSYDATAGRWIVLVSAARQPQAFVTVAISQSGDPLGAWWRYTFDIALNGAKRTNLWMNHPSLGYDENALYIGGDQLDIGTAAFRYAKLRILSKAQLYNGQPATWTDFTRLTSVDGTQTSSPTSVLSQARSDGEYGFRTVSSDGLLSTLWKVTGAPGAPALVRGPAVPSATLDAGQLTSTTPVSSTAAIGTNQALVRFTLPGAGPATVTLVAADGRQVRTLEVPDATAGMNAVAWDGLDAHGARAPAGIYLARVISESRTQKTRVVLVR